MVFIDLVGFGGWWAGFLVFGVGLFCDFGDFGAIWVFWVWVVCVFGLVVWLFATGFGMWCVI